MGAAQEILAVIQTIVYVFAILIVVYIFYQSFYSQYYKILYDFVTLSFYKKQNIDSLLSEQQFLMNHFKYLTRNESQYSGVDPITMFEKISGMSTTIEQNIASLDTFINKYYENFKYTKRYVEAFKEYFLYKKIIENPITQEINIFPQRMIDHKAEVPQCGAAFDALEGHDQKPLQPAKVDCAAPIFKVECYNFYERMLEYLKANKMESSVYSGSKIQTSPEILNLPDPEKIARLYIIDQYAINNTVFLNIYPSLWKYADRFKNVSSNFLRVKELITYIDKISFQISNIYTHWLENPYNNYIVVPEDDEIKKFFVKIFEKYRNSLTEIYSDTFHPDFYTIVDTKVRQTKPETTNFAWYIFEVMKGSSYETLVDQIQYLIYKVDEKIHGSTSIGLYEMKLFMTAYINLTDADKKRIDRTLLKNARYGGIYIKKYDRTKLFNFMEKHPLFTHLYLNTKHLDEDKSKIYNKILAAYQALLYTKKDKTMLTIKDDPAAIYDNYYNNVKSYKDFQNSVMILYLYFVRYQKEIIDIYQDQYKSNKEFFNDIWKPFVHEIWDMRINEYAKRTFQKRQFRKSFATFLKLWRKLGKMVTDMRKEIVNSFTRSLKMKEEDEPLKDDSPL